MARTGPLRLSASLNARSFAGSITPSTSVVVVDDDEGIGGDWEEGAVALWTPSPRGGGCGVLSIKSNSMPIRSRLTFSASASRTSSVSPAASRRFSASWKPRRVAKRTAPEAIVDQDGHFHPWIKRPPKKDQWCVIVLGR